jgi:3-oxoadipate enol-lactonase
VTIAFRIDGAEGKPALVLSNSLGTTWELWDGQLPALERDFTIVRYDHPGHGRSETLNGTLTVEELVDGVVELLDALELERASFCGLSLGGAVGMALALRAPERLERLVLCCTSAHFGVPERWYERARLVRAEGTAAVAERVLERWFTQAFRAREAATVTRFRTMLERTPPDGYAACCEAIARWDARSTVGAITTTTLVIAGEDDVATPPADGAFLARSIPGGELVVLSGAAHLANVEQPGSFGRALLGHLLVPATSGEVGR